jgi:hypothetical protein
MPTENKADRIARERRSQEEAAQSADWAHQVEADREADRREIVDILACILQMLADKGYPWLQEIQVRESIPRRRWFGKPAHDTHAYTTGAWKISSYDTYDPEVSTLEVVYLLSDGRLYAGSYGPKSPLEWLHNLPVYPLTWFAPAEKLTGDRNLPRLLSDIRAFRDKLEVP